MKYIFLKDYEGQWQLPNPPFTTNKKLFKKDDIIDGISVPLGNATAVRTTIKGTLPNSGMVGEPWINIKTSSPTEKLEPVLAEYKGKTGKPFVHQQGSFDPIFSEPTWLSSRNIMIGLSVIIGGIIVYKIAK